MANIIDLYSSLESLDEQSEKRRIYQSNQEIANQIKIEKAERDETDEIIKTLSSVHATAISDMGLDAQFQPMEGMDVSNEDIDVIESGYSDFINLEREKHSDNDRILQTLDLLESQFSNVASGVKAINDYDDSLSNIVYSLDQLDEKSNEQMITSVIENIRTGFGNAIQNNIIEPNNTVWAEFESEATKRLFISKKLSQFTDRPIYDESGEVVGRYNAMENDLWIDKNFATSENINEVNELLQSGNVDDAYTSAKNLDASAIVDRTNRVNTYNKAQKDKIAYEKSLIDARRDAEKASLRKLTGEIDAHGTVIESYVKTGDDGNKKGALFAELNTLSEITKKLSDTEIQAGDREQFSEKIELAFTSLVDKIESQEDGFFEGSDIFEILPEGDKPLTTYDQANVLAGNVYFDKEENALIWNIKVPKKDIREGTGFYKKNDDGEGTYSPIYYSYNTHSHVNKHVGSKQKVDQKMVIDTLNDMNWDIGKFGIGGDSGFGKDSGIARAVAEAANIYLKTRPETWDVMERARRVADNEASSGIVDQIRKHNIENLFVSKIRDFAERDFKASDEELKDMLTISSKMSKKSVNEVIQELYDKDIIDIIGQYTLMDAFTGIGEWERKYILELANENLGLTGERVGFYGLTGVKDPKTKFKLDDFDKEFELILEAAFGGTK